MKSRSPQRYKNGDILFLVHETYYWKEIIEMLEKLLVVNPAQENSDGFDIGGDWGCYIVCSGGCIITKMVAAPMAVAVMDL